MKKTISMLIIFGLCALFTSCEPRMSLMTKEDIDNYLEVSLIYYDNPSAPIHKHESRPGEIWEYEWENFDTTKMEIIETLSTSEAEKMVNAIIMSESWYDIQDINAPDGYCLIILFENGDIFVESFTKNRCFAARYNSQGELIKVYGQGFLSESYVNQYFVY